MRAFVVAVLMVLFAPVAGANPAPGEPLVSDTAEYVLQTAEGAHRVILEWRGEEVWLPSGEVRVLLTLGATLLPVEEAAVGASARSALNPFADSGVVPPQVEVVSLHWAEPWEGSVAWSAGWLDELDGDRRWATRTTLGGCAPQAWLLTWADAACAADVTVEHGSASGLPLRVVGEGWSLDQVAVRRGTQDWPPPLSRSTGEMPRVPLVAWTKEGPASGDLPGHPFADARRAMLAQDPEAAAFLLQNGDARLLQVRHVGSTSVHEATWEDRIQGVPCAAAQAPGAEWSAAWVAEEGSLFALVQRLGDVVGVHRLLESNLDSYSTRHAGGAPATQAPSPAALAEMIQLVPESMGEVTTMTIDFHPDGAVASVGRGTCARDPLTGRAGFTGGSITFVDGRAVSTLRLEAEREGATLLSALGPRGEDPSSSLAAPAAPSGVSGAVAAVAVTGGVVLLSAAFALYSRIRRDQALGHAKRALVYERARRHPGMTLQDLARDLRMPRGTVEHHVRTLERNGYLDVHQGARGLAIHPTGAQYDPHERLLHREHVADLLGAVAASPGISQGEAARLVGMRKSHLSELARELEAAGLLRRARHGRVVGLHPADGSLRSPDSS